MTKGCIPPENMTLRCRGCDDDYETWYGSFGLCKKCWLVLDWCKRCGATFSGKGGAWGGTAERCSHCGMVIVIYRSYTKGGDHSNIVRVERQRP
jgi:hypothetical protein